MNSDEHIAIDTLGEPSEAPPKPDKDLKFSYFEPTLGIILTVIATVIFLGFPQIITIVFIGDRLIPTFDVEVIRRLWVPIILWAVLSIGVDVVYLVERCYTRLLAKIAVIGNAVTVILAFIILFSSRIVYWEYVDFIHRYFEDVAPWFGEILARPNIIILVIMVIVLVIESINVIRKGLKAKDNEENDEDFDDEGVTFTEAEIKPSADK